MLPFCLKLAHCSKEYVLTANCWAKLKKKTGKKKHGTESDDNGKQIEKNKREVSIEKAFSNPGKWQWYFIMKYNLARMDHQAKLHLNILSSCWAHKQCYTL